MIRSIYFYALDLVFGSFKRRIQELESEKFDLEHKLFESQRFEEIAAGKLTEWVGKHDNLLVKYKELVAKLPAELRSQLNV